jgi:hypothetical protein
MAVRQIIVPARFIEGILGQIDLRKKAVPNESPFIHISTEKSATKWYHPHSLCGEATVEPAP